MFVLTEESSSNSSSSGRDDNSAAAATTTGKEALFDRLNKYFEDHIRLEYHLSSSINSSYVKKTEGFNRYVSETGLHTRQDYQDKVLFSTNNTAPSSSAAASSSITTWHMYPINQRYYARRDYVCERYNDADSTIFLYPRQTNPWKILKYFFDEGNTSIQKREEAEYHPLITRFRDIKIDVDTKVSDPGFTDF